MTKLFVWIKGFQSPEAQIWPNGVPVDGSNKPKHIVFDKKELADNDGRSINELIKDYPCKEINND